MQQLSKKLVALLTVMLPLALLLAVFVPSASAAVTVAPVIFEYDKDEAVPGTVLRDVVRVTNPSQTDDLILKPTVADFYYDEDGNMVFIEEGIENPEKWSLKEWVEIKAEPFILPPTETREIEFTITIPEDAESGGKYGAMFFEEVSSLEDLTTEEGTIAGGMGVSGRVGALILVRLGNAELTGSFDSIEVGAFSNPSSEGSFFAKNFFEQGPVVFKTTVTNTGNAHFTPTGTIKIFNMFGSEVDTINIDDKRVFPGNTRDIYTTYDRAYLWGKYTAQAEIIDGDGNIMPVKEITFSGLAWKLVLIWTLLVVVILIVLIVGIKRYNKWVLTQAKKK